MKTIEEKAKAYDEAKKIIKANLDALNDITEMGEKVVNIQSIKNSFYRAFPELKESEDEKIRKEIIFYLKHNCKWQEQWIAWLEKQGKLIEYYEDKLDRCACENFNKGYKAAIEHQKEKQGEQKPADKVEPKFKIGDFLVNDYCMGKVIELTKDAYLLDTGQGIPFSCEHNVHLWTINDANEGEVLCDYHESFDNPLIFILKKFEQINFGLTRPSDYSSYCFLTAGDLQRFKEGTYHHKHNIKPATKEQCDLLFQKMKEVGYEWDAEKKELKKIEPKPAWSEEDNRKIKFLINLVNEWCDKAPNATSMVKEEMSDWLKSLRPQKQWKPSDEQIKAIRLARSFVTDDFDKHPTLSESLIELEEQLKKLKEYGYEEN